MRDDGVLRETSTQTQQHIDTAHQRNTSTHWHINSLVHWHIAHQHINTSTANQDINILAHQHTSTSARWKINTLAHQRNSSTGWSRGRCVAWLSFLHRLGIFYQTFKILKCLIINIVLSHTNAAQKQKGAVNCINCVKLLHCSMVFCPFTVKYSKPLI